SLTRPAPGPPLFPYTTLFRSGSKLFGKTPSSSNLNCSGWTISCFSAIGYTLINATAISREQTIVVVFNQMQRRQLRITSANGTRSEEHTSELQSRFDLVCRLL